MKPVVCPKHGHPLEMVEEGVLNGTLVRYFAGCPGTTTKIIRCQYHALRGEHDPSFHCACRGGVHRPCHAEVRTEESTADEPSLFEGGAA